MIWKQDNVLTASQVPSYLRDPGIIVGYRKTDQSWSYYIKSIFQIHNETLNIWTHIVAALIHVVLLYNGTGLYNFYSEKQSWPVLVFGICCLFSTCSSVLAHIFHSKNIDIHYNLFLLDYVGVSLYGYATGTIALYCFSDRPTYNIIESTYVIAHWLFCWFDFAVICVTKMNTSTNWTRKIAMMVCLTFHAVLLTATVARKYWLFLNGDTRYTISIANYNWIYIMFFLQAMSYGSHLPELFRPGVFDIIGQSHQIFHVVATSTQISQTNAMYYEISNGNCSYGDPSLSFLAISAITLIIADLCTIYILRWYFPIDRSKKEI